MLDELKTNQWDESQNAGEEVPLDLDPDLLPTLHIFDAPGSVEFITDEALQKRRARNQHTDPNPPEPQTQPGQPKARGTKETFSFPLFLLILLLFLFFDAGDSYLTVLFAPTATITILPQRQSITVRSSTTTGKLLSPITVSQSQTVQTTGHGHQDAKQATGSLTFYNGLFSQQFVASGTVFIGRDGVNVVTTQPAYIPAGNPSTGYGEVTVTSQAQRPGQAGNIPAGDITSTITNGLLVKNNQFRNGQDTRDYKTVTKADTDGAEAALKAKVTASMTAALNVQLMPGEQIQPIPCTPTVTANHLPGDEAETVEVTVSQTCTAIAYDSQALTAQATRLLTAQAVKKFGQGYMLYGNVQVSVTKATTTNKTGVLLAFTIAGTYIYQLTTKAQQRIENLVAGKPREAALNQLVTLPGVQHVSISGISDNQPIPDDLSHIRLLIMVGG